MNGHSSWAGCPSFPIVSGGKSFPSSIVIAKKVEGIAGADVCPEASDDNIGQASSKKTAITDLEAVFVRRVDSRIELAKLEVLSAARMNNKHESA